MKLLNKNILVMQLLVAEVEDDSGGIEQICVGMNHAPIINFKDGIKIMFSWQELCDMAIEYKKKALNADQES